MRTCTLLLINLLISLSYISTGWCEPTLKEGVGYGSIIVKESTLADLRKNLGSEDEIERTKVPNSNNYVYRDLGLKFNVNSTGRVFSIMTLHNFDGVTSKGISLSSSSTDIEQTYGTNPVIHPKKKKDTASSWSYPELGVIVWLKKGLPIFGKRKIKSITITAAFQRPSKEYMDKLK